VLYRERKERNGKYFAFEKKMADGYVPAAADGFLQKELADFNLVHSVVIEFCDTINKKTRETKNRRHYLCCFYLVHKQGRC